MANSSKAHQKKHINVSIPLHNENHPCARLRSYYCHHHYHPLLVVYSGQRPFPSFSYPTLCLYSILFWKCSNFISSHGFCLTTVKLLSCHFVALVDHMFSNSSCYLFFFFTVQPAFFFQLFFKDILVFSVDFL